MLQSHRNFFKMCSLFIVGLVFFSAQAVQAESPAVQAESPAEVMELLPPQKTIGIPLMEAFNLRQSGTTFSGFEPSKQDLSNILWAAFGVNRQDGRLTVPTLANFQNVTIYVALRSGVWKYDTAKRNLTQINNINLTQKLKAPMALIYVAPIVPLDIAGMHVGAIFQNVSLYCASAKLESRLKLQRNLLDNDLSLPEGYKIYITQRISTIPAE